MSNQKLILNKHKQQKMEEQKLKSAVTKESPPELTELESVVYILQDKVLLLEKAFAYNKEVFRQLDVTANKLNPDRFHKNQATPDTISNGKSCDNTSERYPKSGIILKLENIIIDLDMQTRLIDDFSNEEQRLTVNFFKDHI